ncbi:LOW QUALITY PROTEIN: adenosine 5'-monophosphoramidase HINT2-like [Accipiter gentilis]|uniref:LOW QUALITY PROTEIN: adenosine 5'-monophosphoramidase HINT2-like n=1 Tax=Astur gentilis TaxID=8957 RepID=UPI0021101604|nr:LOW QUALITY PROTEIN: adenosine 5'-monophosphoramidase HINT2-like [Accipiter gentilis]
MRARSTRADPPRGRGQAATTDGTANRDAGSAGGDLAAQRAPRRAWPSGGSAGATSDVVAAGEIVGARAARPGGATTVFGRITGKAVPANVIYEDEERLAFRDVSPQALTLFLVTPKEPIIWSVAGGRTNVSWAFYDCWQEACCSPGPDQWIPDGCG